MSTATLLILTARLRSIAQADGYRYPAPFATLSGRSRGTPWMRTACQIFQRLGAGNEPLRSYIGERFIQPLACAGARYPFSRARGFWMRGCRPGEVLARWASIFLNRDGMVQCGGRSALFPHAASVGLLGAAILLLADGSAAAQSSSGEQQPGQNPTVSSSEADGSARIGGKPTDAPCVAVDIAGHRVGHLDCASQRLEAAARTAQAQTRSAIDAPVVSATSPDVQTGVANQTATRQRMGNTFGTSVHPQRPNRVFAPPRGGPRP